MQFLQMKISIWDGIKRFGERASSLAKKEKKYMAKKVLQLNTHTCRLCSMHI